MTSDVSRYRSLMTSFLAQEISAQDFQTAFIDLFKTEAQQLDPAVFSALDELFGDVDSFVPDDDLRAELERSNPGFYLDEPRLRHKVSAVSEQLAAR